VFGIGHLYQGNDLLSALGAFGLTALGSLWFSWLLVAWDSLWVPIGLHVLLNLYWELFTNDQTAVGDGLSNLFRGLVIALSIVLTLRLRRSAITKRGELWTRPVRFLFARAVITAFPGSLSTNMVNAVKQFGMRDKKQIIAG
jgi:hypothetical protein